MMGSFRLLLPMVKVYGRGFPTVGQWMGRMFRCGSVLPYANLQCASRGKHHRANAGGSSARASVRWGRCNEIRQATGMLAAVLADHRIDFSYNSGHIENEDITYHDTREIFETGRTIAFTGDVRTLSAYASHHPLSGFSPRSFGVNRRICLERCRGVNMRRCPKSRRGGFQNCWESLPVHSPTSPLR